MWEIVSQTEKKDTYTLTADNGDVIKVGKAKNGLRTIVIGNGKPVVCSQITTKTLPDYPTKDTCTAFRDTHYQTDTVTLVGWLKNMPKKEKDKDSEFEVIYTDIFTKDQMAHYGKMDSLGRFVVKVPLRNSSEVLLDWRRTTIQTVFEPGETYFFLHDYKTRQQLFMGKNCRLQNEMLTFPVKIINGEHGDNMDVAAMMQYLESLKAAKAEAMDELEALGKAHPTISDRYTAYVAGYYNANEGYRLMQGRMFMDGDKLQFPSEEYFNYITRQHWQQRKHPYTLYTDFVDELLGNYVHLVINKYFGVRGPGFTFHVYSDLEAAILRRYRDAGKVAITDEELAIVERSSESAIDHVLGRKSEETLIEEMAEYRAINEREDIGRVLEEETPLYYIYWALAALDSIGCDRDTHDIIITYMLQQIIDQNKEPLTETAMQFFEDNVTLPAAKSFLRAEQEKYLSIQRRDTSNSASLKTNDDFANMSDGEKILRKITEPYRGRLILLDVWGTWCIPCKVALEDSKEEFERLKDYNLVYLYLANRSEDEAWKNVIKEYDLTGEDIVHYNLPADQQSAIEHFLNVHVFPFYRLIDRDGTVLDVNADPRDLEGLARLLEKLK